jgi:dipeptidyl aminopeptidase/acylaminoacyl peptidase
VTDLATLATDTHKFESRYLDRLVGPLPHAADVYRERSPLSHLDGLSAPLLVLQGTKDPIVPPSQAEAVIAELRRRTVPHAYLTFDEGHGFRSAATIVRALTAELSFYIQVFGLDLPDLDPVEIAFADRLRKG